MNMYRLSWEMVSPNQLGQFSNADPTYYKNTTQTVPNSEIPDEYWHAVSKEDSNPWQQYKQLKQWANEDREFIRNVRLEEATSEPTWREIRAPWESAPAEPAAPETGSEHDDGGN